MSSVRELDDLPSSANDRNKSNENSNDVVSSESLIADNQNDELTNAHILDNVKISASPRLNQISQEKLLSPSVCSDNQDEDIILKWDDDDVTESMNQVVVDEIELLKDLEEDIQVLNEDDKSNNVDDTKTYSLDDVDHISNKGIKQLIDSGGENVETEFPRETVEKSTVGNIDSDKDTPQVTGKSLKDLNAMLEIPIDLELSDDDCQLTGNWNKITNDLNDRGSQGVIAPDKTIIENEDKLIEKHSDKNDEIPLNIESILLKSLEDEEKLLDDGSLIMVSNKSDIIEVIDEEEITEPVQLSPVPEIPLISEEEELQNAIQGIEEEMKESDLESTVCVSIIDKPFEDLDTVIADTETILDSITDENNEEVSEDNKQNIVTTKAHKDIMIPQKYSIESISQSNLDSSVSMNNEATEIFDDDDVDVQDQLVQEDLTKSDEETTADVELSHEQDNPSLKILNREDVSQIITEDEEHNILSAVTEGNIVKGSIYNLGFDLTQDNIDQAQHSDISLIPPIKLLQDKSGKYAFSAEKTDICVSTSDILKESINKSKIDEKLQIQTESNENQITVNSPTSDPQNIEESMALESRSSLNVDPNEANRSMEIKTLDQNMQIAQELSNNASNDKSNVLKDSYLQEPLSDKSSKVQNDLHTVEENPLLSKEINVLTVELNEESSIANKSQCQPSDKVSLEAGLDKDKKSHINEGLPSTSKVTVITGFNSKTNNEAIPSTSKEEGDTNVQDTSDSLGLLAESSRVMVDDEDQEDDDDGDDEEEFDPEDESSNQLTAEHSEDSNTHQMDMESKDISQTDEQNKAFDRPFEFTMEKDDEQCEETTNNDTVNTNEEADADESVDAAEESIDIDTFKLSDTSDTDECKNTDLPATKEDFAESCSAKTGEPTIDLDSEDEVQAAAKSTTAASNMTSVNLPADIEVMASHSDTISTDIVTKEGEIVISGIPRPAPVKVARLNTDEVSIKTMKVPTLEVFNLDSDEDMEIDNKDVPQEADVNIEPEQAAKRRKCINDACPNDSLVYFLADNTTMSFYNGKKLSYVCESCADVVVRRNGRLIEGIRNFEDLLALDLGKDCKDPIEVLDSDSEDEVDPEDLEKQMLGVTGAKLVEEQLADIINEQWEKFKMDSRLLDSVDNLKSQMENLEKESKEVDEMLKECQVATDRFRNDLYATFEAEIHDLPAITIVDTPYTSFINVENAAEQTRHSKRRLSSSQDMPAKRKPIPLGYAPIGKDVETKPALIDDTTDAASGDRVDDDNTDITVVQLSTENAPSDLPPAGELERPALRPGMAVYAMRNMYGTWAKGHVVEVGGASNSPYSSVRVKFVRSQKNTYKILNARCVAYSEPANARMTIGTRVIAQFQGSTENANNKEKETYYSGIVAEVPNPVNKFRYLIFFDDGYAQYASHANTRLVCEYSLQVWEEVHPFSRLFVKEYLLNYPQRPMVRLRADQSIRTEWNDKWWPSKVVEVDASLVLVQFIGEKARDRMEWIYRGSTRLEPLYREMKAAGRHRPRAMPRAQAHSRTNMPIVEYTRSDDQIKSVELQNMRELNNEEIRRQRAVAKKSTTAPLQPTTPSSVKLDNFTSRVVYYTPKNAVRPYNIQSNHVCGPGCKRKDVLALKDLRTYNPLAKPLLSGWERQLVRWKYDKRVMYRAPCGRRIRNMDEMLRYLQTIQSDMGVDLFDFGSNTHCLAEFVINKCIISKKDLSHGKENVPVPCVNYYDDSLPEFCSYNTERTPTAGVPLNLDPEFLCGCDCADDCEDKTKCACWKLTLEGARTIGLEGDSVGYVYKRLPEPLPSGIYECNSRCKCKSTCLNRVAQHPLQLKLQVFKTMNRGWGIRALNDVPKGAFLCIYAGNLLTDATANLDGLNEGDEYLAELDYIEVVEQMKEGYEEDIPESIKALDKKESEKSPEESESEEKESSEEEEEKNNSEDDEFKPERYISGVTEFNKRLRKRKKKEKEESERENRSETEKEKNSGEDCITISDDEEVREPSRFTAAAGMGENDYVSKYKSVRTLFGEDEACYIMDAKVQGNIGRYLNHSCCPNVFVQNVFVDTHDPRFPWVAFFALTHIKAGKELTWNYNYDVGSVPGKVLYCHCGEVNCRGRLL